jgi:hypothetical protein
MSKKYEVLIGCRAEGAVLKPGDVVDLEDRVADKLMNLAQPRIKPAPEVEVKSKPADVKRKAPETRVIDPIADETFGTRGVGLPE